MQIVELCNVSWFVILPPFICADVCNLVNVTHLLNPWKPFPITGLPVLGWMMPQSEATRTTWETRPPWGSSTPSQLLTTLSFTTSPTHSWSWCLSSSKTCAGSKRSFTMRRGYKWPFLHIFTHCFLKIYIRNRCFKVSVQCRCLPLLLVPQVSGC